MANHKSALKRIRSNESKRVRNKYQFKSARTAVQKLRGMDKKKDAEKFLPIVSGMLDKLAKRNVIHKSKASNLKSKLTKHVASLS